MKINAQQQLSAASKHTESLAVLGQFQWWSNLATMTIRATLRVENIMAAFNREEGDTVEGAVEVKKGP